MHALLLALALQALPDFREQVIDENTGGVGYNSCLADLNGDGKLDIVVVTERKDQVLWYENPSWKRRVLVAGHPKAPEPLTPFDVDGDGKTEIVIGSDWMMGNTTDPGGVWILRRPDDLDQPWTPVKIDEEPAMHRLAVVTLGGKKELVASCLQGRGTKAPDWSGPGAPQYLLRRPADPFTGKWTREPIVSDLHRVHGVTAFDWDGDGDEELLLAAFEGVHVYKRGAKGAWTRQVLGRGDLNNPGASEVKVSTLPGGRRIVATVEPWHGNVAAIYVAPEDAGGPWKRRVILEGYQVGHGVVPGDFTGTGVDSLLYGFRGEKGKGHAVVILHPLDAKGEKWETKVIDVRDMEADGVHAADFDGDGDLDIAATGKGTNVKVYWNRRK